MNNIGFTLYLVYVCSYFLRLPARIEFLAIIRFDLLLVAIILVITLLTAENSEKKYAEPSKILIALVIYILISLPFVEWPGSVIRANNQTFLKGFLFYVVSASLLTSRGKLKRFVFVFLFCQTFRILEPLYMNIADGYWGSVTNIWGGEYMDRLSGSPYDVINPNGLAFVVTSVIAVAYYVTLAESGRIRALFYLGLPAFLYTLVLTGSRTGLLGLVVVVIAICMKSKRRVVSIITISVFAGVLWNTLTPLQTERYLSIALKDVRFAHTAQGRIDAWFRDLGVGMNHPIVGHGLGTSLEANINTVGEAKVSHNLYLEIFQELGIVGLVIFLLYMKSILGELRRARLGVSQEEHPDFYLWCVVNALHVWFIMNVLFSLASYGLSSYEWYLLGGLSVVVRRLIEGEGAVVAAASGERLELGNLGVEYA